MLLELAVGGLLGLGALALTSKAPRRSRPKSASQRDQGTGRGGVEIDTGDPLGGLERGAQQGLERGARYGPIGAIVGAAVGGLLGLIDEVKPFGSQVRRAIKAWLRDSGDATHNGNVDATLFRWALLHIHEVWRAPDGRIAAKVERVRNDADALYGRAPEFHGWDGRVSAVRSIQRAAEDISGQIAWTNPQDEDPPAFAYRHRAAFRRFREGVRAGDLYLIGATQGAGPLVPTFPAPPHVPAYTSRYRPRMDVEHPIRGSAAREFVAVTVTADNVDALAAKFDRQVRATWKAGT